MTTTDNGTRYLIHMIGTPKIERGPHGSIRPAGLWWNNQDGWGDRDSATVFPHNGPDTLDLPIDGEWVATYIGIPANT
jgi:hypothetical protein